MSIRPNISALAHASVDHWLALNEIGPLLVRLVDEVVDDGMPSTTPI